MPPKIHGARWEPVTALVPFAAFPSGPPQKHVTLAILEAASSTPVGNFVGRTLQNHGKHVTLAGPGGRLLESSRAVSRFSARTPKKTRHFRDPRGRILDACRQLWGPNHRKLETLAAPEAASSMLVGNFGGPGPNSGRGRPGVARSGREGPGAARDGQDRPGAAGNSQEQPGAARSGQDRPGAARSGPERARAARNGQEWPGAAKGGQNRLGPAKTDQGRPGPARGSQNWPGPTRTDQFWPGGLRGRTNASGLTRRPRGAGDTLP